jgi:hypothetical protein
MTAEKARASGMGSKEVPRAISQCFRLVIVLLFAGVLAGSPAWAQAPASVSFTFDFPASIPDHYKIVVFADGRATYESTGKLTPDSDPPDPFHLEFQVTPDTRTKVFDLAARAKYFEGKVDSGKKNLASTGDKTLSYQDDQRKTEAHYNFSPNQSVQALTAIFQNTSTTLEFGRRLTYYHQYQKLALDEELKRMDEMNRSGEMAELQAIASILKEIVADPSVINVSRLRAQRLLAKAGVH